MSGGPDVMRRPDGPWADRWQGIRLRAGGDPRGLVADGERTRAWLANLGLAPRVETACGRDAAGPYLDFRLDAESAARCAPGHDTSGLAAALGLDPDGGDRDLDVEILAAMLLGPIAFELPSYDELVSAVRLRRRIVRAANRTVLAFDTEQAERPEGCWTYAESTGFTIVPGHDLADALRKATQPDASGRLYSFSCYRATEYVLLLALAQELAECNPGLLEALRQQWERAAIMSGRFHEVFLQEYGSLGEPLPARYYVPGDRLWFRNPDEASANVEGYEGSWVFYLGAGRFTNFWKPGCAYSLADKCIELYHWRHGLRHDAAGRLWMDESAVEARVQASARDPAEVAAILERMLRLRDPSGVYAAGGCIDASREFIRCVRPGTCTLSLPGLAPQRAV
ncbi:hypothetical protein [Castellaniella sp. GW247-6E4]|uniref:hypothetical protein n=1 Tax=Castellaniella sp. GW247-6E4 TaxID=3140380 RepID=UPI0033158C3C